MISNNSLIGLKNNSDFIIQVINDFVKESIKLKGYCVLHH